MKKSIRIATRNSPLALWQANFVKDKLEEIYPDLTVTLLGIQTQGDKMLGTPLNKIGGKGLFVKELEKAILDGEADIAVHSIKDMPTDLPEHLTLAVVLKRGDSRDAFVANRYDDLTALPERALIGTSSLRRQSQVLAIRPDLQVLPLRGNVGTRLAKLDSGDFDAIILASAGLQRLGLENKIKMNFTPQQMLPAAGQGAIGVECRSADSVTLELLSILNDEDTRAEIMAERALTKVLGGSCQFPIAAHATVTENKLVLNGYISNIDGSRILKTHQVGRKEDAKEIGTTASSDLINQGALEILKEVLAEIKYDDAR